MGLLGFLKPSAHVGNFAAELAQDIARRYPPSIDRQPDKQPSVNRLTRIIEDACAKAVAFQAEHRLGWIGKARVGNAFRWELTNLGYRKEFVELATEAVLVHLSKPTKPG